LVSFDKISSSNNQKTFKQVKTLENNQNKGSGYPLFVLGDLNGFFGLMFDNLTNLSFLAGILISFGYPKYIIFTKMFPGTAIGVLFGDFVYTWLAFRLAKSSGKNDVTAMPLGLDTPSTVGIALVILGPVFLDFKGKGIAEDDAAIMTWYVGMATMMMIGIFKLVLSFCGSWVRRIVPQAGLLGSLAGIGLALLGVLPLIEIFGMPLVGMVSLGIILYSLVAKIKLPYNIPGVFAAVVAGTVLYYVFGPLGWAGGTFQPLPEYNFLIALPVPNLGFLSGLSEALKFLPLAIPFALLTVVGGINCTESAKVAGDDYNTRDILLTEAIATMVAGLCGGVAQSTPYIGHLAYKRMGSRAGYTFLTGIFIGLGGIFGYVSFFVELIPQAVLAPILVFVGLEIMVQAFAACPIRHAPAVAMAYFPSVVQMLLIRLKLPNVVPLYIFTRLLHEGHKALPEMLVIVALGNGFIITGMLWAAFLAELIDRKLKNSAFYLVILALLSFFGIIHSATREGNMYLPWTLVGTARKIPYQFAFCYLALAGVILLLSLSKESSEPLHEEH